MLSEISQSQKTNTVCFHLYEVLRVVKITGTEVEWWWPGVGGGDNGGWLFNGCRVLLLQDEESSGDGWWEGCTRILMCLISLNCIVKKTVNFMSYNLFIYLFMNK